MADEAAAVSHNYSVESTIYRRRSDGSLVGTPETPVTKSPASSQLDPHVVVAAVTPLPDAFLPIEEDSSEAQIEAPFIDSVPTYIAEEQFPIAGAPDSAFASDAGEVHINDVFDSGDEEFVSVIEPNKSKRQKLFQRKVKDDSKKFKKTPAGRVIHAIFSVLRVVVIVYLAIYIALGVWTSKSLQKTNATPAKPIAATAGQNWLLTGSDSRRGLTLHEQKVLHTGPDSGTQRTDVIMIVHIDAKGHPTLISLPRDSYVKIPAHTALDGTKVGTRKNKINAAYSFGGAPLLVATIEKNTGLHVDHYMEIGFAGIKEITDAVNGVRICVPRNYDDHNSNLHVKKGCQQMNGKKALAYVRMRYADPKGDLGRIQRQQQYIAAVLHKVATPGTLLNPFAMKNFSKAATDSVIVGTDDGVRDLLSLGMAMRNLSQGKGKVMTVPVSDPNATTAAGSSVLWDQAKAQELFKSLGAQ